jgi:AraC family transcriptional regulator
MEELEPPRFEEFGPIRITGLGESYTDATSSGIPALWQRFDPYLGKIRGQIGGITYGVLTMPSSPAGYWDYVCGVQVSDFSEVPADFVKMDLSKEKYAVFSHRGHISTLRSTWNQIWTKWVPELKLPVTRGPRIELYSEEFRPAKPGGVEIWIPIKQ